MNPPKKPPLPGAGLHQALPDAFREEETMTRCPACMPMSPNDPSAGGLGRCIVCQGSQRITRENLDGRYHTIACPSCYDGSCKLCNGKGLVKFSTASNHRRGLRP